MAIAYMLKSTDDLRGILAKALEAGHIDGVLGLFRQPSGDALALNLTNDAAQLDLLEPVAPVMPVQAARALQQVKFTETPLRIACVIKPCELRATVDLVKLKQVMPDKLVFISMDCGGAVEMSAFKASCAAGGKPVADLKAASAAGRDYAASVADARYACTICDRNTPVLADIRLRTFGTTGCLEALTEKGKAFLAAAGAEAVETDLSSSDAAAAAIRAGRSAARAREREQFRNDVRTPDDFAREISSCIRCHNCMVNCPMDYCKECVFKSPTFDHPSDNYEQWMKRKGSIRLPADTLIFHMTRLNHMSTSCVSCGACESACPAGIKVSRIFAFIGEETQGIFEYEAGRAWDEELPVATFREKELSNI